MFSASGWLRPEALPKHHWGFAPNPDYVAHVLDTKFLQQTDVSAWDAIVNDTLAESYHNWVSNVTGAAAETTADRKSQEHSYSISKLLHALRHPRPSCVRLAYRQQRSELFHVYCQTLQLVIGLTSCSYQTRLPLVHYYFAYIYCTLRCGLSLVYLKCFPISLHQ